ncbi:hypothetical protein BDR04DRAFT_1165185 [Suillus decipiens]|nr:hypothetical protein BDR04DRAFT_1165185 [Suillus decipiens]
MPPAAALAGSSVPSFITDNFNRGEKVDSKSGRYYLSCKHCPDALRIQGRDNQLPNHLIHKCRTCPAEIQKQARLFVMDKASGEDVVEVINSNRIDSSPTPQGAAEPVMLGKRKKCTLNGFVDYPLTKEQHSRANIKLLRFTIDADITFSASENDYLLECLNELWPSYMAPSRYVLSHTLMDSEPVRVQQEEINRLTLLLDGWEDLLRRGLLQLSEAASCGPRS